MDFSRLYRTLRAAKTRYLLLGVAFASHALFLPGVSGSRALTWILFATFAVSVITLMVMAPTVLKMLRDLAIATAPVPVMTLLLLTAVGVMNLAQRVVGPGTFNLGAGAGQMITLIETVFAAWAMIIMVLGWPVIGLAFALRAGRRRIGRFITSLT